MNSYYGNGAGNLTATAGTPINCLIPPSPVGRGGFTRVSKVVDTPGTTAHVGTFLRPLGNTTLSAAAAAAQSVIALTADPGPSGNGIAANDWIAIRRAADGITRLYQVSSVSGLNVTLTANLAAGLGLAKGDKVWMFGAVGDTDPRTGNAHPGLNFPASTTTTYEDRENGVCATLGTDEPILVQIDNATAASKLNQVSYGYTRE
jgi:hypothetical protein